MALIAKGFPFKAVADELGISFSAVHKHQYNTFRKRILSIPETC